MSSQSPSPEPLPEAHDGESPQLSPLHRRDNLTIRQRDYDQIDGAEDNDDLDREEFERWRRRRRSTTRSRTRSRTRSPDQRITPSGSRSSYERYDSRSPRRRSPRPSSPNREPKHLKFRPVGPPLQAHLRGVSAVKFSPDGTKFASCSADQTLILWALQPTPKILHTFEGHLAGLSTLSWSPSSRTVATGSDDKCIRLWDVPSLTPHSHPLIGHHNYVYSLAFSPKGNMLVSGSFDEAVFLWDARSGRVMRSLPAHSDPVGGVGFSRDGTMVCSCAGDGLIRVWDTQTGQCLKTLVHEDRKPVTSVQFVPNSRFVLAWTLDSCVRLWDYAEGKCVKTYQGHENTRYSLSGAVGRYGEGGKDAFVVSGSEDGSLLAWDVSSKEVLWRAEGAHEGPVLGVDIWRANDGESTWMVSCGLDKTIRVWREAGEEGEEQPLVNGNGVGVMDVDGVARDQVKTEPEDTIMETVEEFQA